MENKIRSTLNEIYFGKTKDIVNDLRQVIYMGMILYTTCSYIAVHVFMSSCFCRSVGDLNVKAKQQMLASELTKRMQSHAQN